MRVLVACEESQTVCKAFRAKGHEAYSCDKIPCSGGHPEWHIQDDAVKIAYEKFTVSSFKWDLMIAHPPCTRLTNAGRRWMHNPPKGRTMVDIWREFFEAVRLYEALRNAPIDKIAIENPIMHDHAKEALGDIKRSIVQPWWFGDKAFKATGFELIGLPPLIEGKNSLRNAVPKSGTIEHKEWSAIHRMSPGPERAKLRSKTFPGIAKAMAEQWG